MLCGSVSSLMPHAPRAQADRTLAQLIERVIALSGCDLVMILDHVSMLEGGDDKNAQMALKAARDAVTLHADAASRFLLIATEADPKVVRQLAMGSGRAFFGAPIEALPRI